MKVFLTGASGFIGMALTKLLSETGYEVTANGRNQRPGPCPADVRWLSKAPSSLTSVDLADQDCVIHLAALANTRGSFSEELVAVNQELAAHLANCAVAAKINKFILFSSSKAVSEFSIGEDTQPEPTSPYGRSKLAAERVTQKILQGTGVELYIVRPVPVYGRPLKSNFKMLERIVDLQLPLPLGSITAKRSFLYIENLLDFVVRMLEEGFESGTYNLADAHSQTLPEFLSLVAAARGRRLRIFNSPVLLTFLSRVLPQNISNLLLHDADVGVSDLQAQGVWRPPHKTDEGVLQAFGNSAKAC